MDQRTLTKVTHALGAAAKRMTLIAAAGWLLTLATGCASGPCSTWCGKFWEVSPSAKGNVSTVLTYWENRVRYAPDTLSNGNPIPGLAGRVYLISEEQGSGQMVDAAGNIVVDLYDMTPSTNGTPPKMLERWEFDRETLKRLKREDKIGNGYSLFLPWSSYRPEITQVKLVLSYAAAAGFPLFANPVAISLRSDEPITIHNRQIVPAQRQTFGKN